MGAATRHFWAKKYLHWKLNGILLGGTVVGNRWKFYLLSIMTDSPYRILSYITINLNIIPSITIPTTINVYKAKDFPFEIFALGFSGFLVQILWANLG